MERVELYTAEKSICIIQMIYMYISIRPALIVTTTV